MVETIRFGVDAHCHITTSGSASLAMGMTVGEDFTLGGAYASGTWSNTSTIMEPTFAPSGPTLMTTAAASLSCELLPRFTLLFYDVIGPYISVTPSTSVAITANGTVLSYELDAAVTGELGVEAAPGWAGAALLQKWVGLDDAKVSLFAKSATLASGSL